VGKVENSREKGQYVGNVHRVLLRLKTNEDEEGVRKVEDVKLVGMVDMIGTFREPADFRFMGDTRHPKDQVDPMLTMCPLRFDGPVSSLLRSKDTTVVRRYVARVFLNSCVGTYLCAPLSHHDEYLMTPPPPPPMYPMSKVQLPRCESGGQGECQGEHVSEHCALRRHTLRTTAWILRQSQVCGVCKECGLGISML